MIVTKLRIGDANTMMAEGGIQAADKANDSPAQHYLDAFGGGHYAAVPELLRKLVMDGPGAVKWLNELGVEFDKAEDGTMITTHGGGTSRKRMHAAADYSGAEIMRTLRDEVWNREIPVVDFTAAIELILDENGHAAGAVLLNMETGRHLIGPRQDRHHLHRRRGTPALSGLPHLQPLRRHRRWPHPRLSRGRAAPLRRHPPVPSHRRGLSAADLRRAGHGKGAFHGAPCSSTPRAKLSCTRWRPATCPPLPSSASARPAARA